ncbi:MAG: transcriptional regulator [Alysiella sp.]|uniref:transcriptional regulator n=1 Tax=Alysiella sp. TaxID=1872483 RepID=UPI0026DCD0AC|nr:transcriptional regulator [Alysiella sp.]MDO4434150.1 transcriptional regulator [Alysiella sp.]
MTNQIFNLKTNLIPHQLRTMGHPERLQLLLHLLHNECSIHELADLTGLETNAIANHMLKMRQLQMVDYTRFHRVMQYRIVSDTVMQLLQTIVSTQNTEQAI